MKHILKLAALVFATYCFGQEACPPPIDMNSNGSVDIEDFLNVLGLFGDTDYDADGIWDSVDDCVGEYDECGFCNGPGLPEGFCSCTESLDALGECGGDCANDFDGDGVCDEFLGPCFDETILYHGYEYNLVVIGNDCWFAENLRTVSYSNGDPLSQGLGQDDWGETTLGATAVYGGMEDDCQDYSPTVDACDSTQSFSAYGRLYNSFAVLDNRGLCPSGWHVPSRAEWLDFIQDYDGEEPLGKAMKEPTGWFNDGNGSNELGFAAKPAGYIHDLNGESRLAGKKAGFWSSTASGSMVYDMNLSSSSDDFWISFAYPPTGLSVRCLKDSE